MSRSVADGCRLTGPGSFLPSCARPSGNVARRPGFAPAVAEMWTEIAEPEPTFGGTRRPRLRPSRTPTGKRARSWPAPLGQEGGRSWICGRPADGFAKSAKRSGVGVYELPRSDLAGSFAPGGRANGAAAGHPSAPAGDPFWPAAAMWGCPWIASSHRRVSKVVWTQDAAVAAAYRVDARGWSELFGELMDPIEARFSRPEPGGGSGTSWLGCWRRYR